MGLGSLKNYELSIFKGLRTELDLSGAPFESYIWIHLDKLNHLHTKLQKSYLFVLGYVFYKVHKHSIINNPNIGWKFYIKLF